MLSSFAPILPEHPHTLILGSMPSVASLDAQQYYGHRHNAFWKIMGAMLGFQADMPYEMRRRALQAAGFALWDVLAECKRPGSLDASIDHASAIANDIAGLLQQYPTIGRIWLNGVSVQQLFKRHVLKTQTLPAHIEVLTLPSTSPANARMGFEEKLKIWQKCMGKE